MPTVLRVSGLRFVVYLNDHSPAHVHVIGPGWVVVVNLEGPEVREVAGRCVKADVRGVLDLVGEHGAMLLDAWSRFHG